MFEESKQGAVDVIRGIDTVSADHIELLRTAFDRCLESGQPRVVFDMQSVPLIDSAGLELLLDAQENYQARGGLLKLAAANALCREILKVTAVGNRFELFPNTAAAVGSFSR